MKDRAGSWEMRLIRSTAEQSINRGSPLATQLVAAWLIKAMVDEIEESRAKLPLFSHDCERCQFLGHHERYDLYVCPSGPMTTVVARWSDEGPDYKSTSFFHQVEEDSNLKEAYKRAVERGYIPHYPNKS